MRSILALAACAAILIPTATSAQDGPEAPNLVGTFERVCLTPGVEHGDRVAQIEGLVGWTEDPTISVYIQGLEVSRSIGGKPRFRKYEAARQWSGKIDGLNAKILLLSFPEKERFRYSCVMLVDGIENAMPYGGELREAFKRFGAKPRSVDLVHYYEFSGTLKPGEQPVAEKHKVHGEIFSRSQAGETASTTHIFLAY